MIIQAANLPELRARHIRERESIGSITSREPRFIFCSGSFDLLHPGHVWFLEQCKHLGGYLVVSVGSDAVIARRKPGRPIIGEAARVKMVDSLNAVDYCYLDTISTPECPLACLPHAFGNLRPDVYVVTADAFDMPTRSWMCEENGVPKMIVVGKSKSDLSISTTAIVEKICSAQER